LILVIVIGFDGRIYYISMSYPGHLNDIVVCFLIENSSWWELMMWYEWALADKGTKGFRGGSNAITPLKGRKDPEAVACNREVPSPSQG